MPGAPTGPVIGPLKNACTREWSRSKPPEAKITRPVSTSGPIRTPFTVPPDWAKPSTLVPVRITAPAASAASVSEAIIDRPMVITPRWDRSATSSQSMFPVASSR